MASSTTPFALEVKNLELFVTTYQDHKKQDCLLARDVSFSLKSGQIVDLVGASGAGKSTLLKSCARLYPATYTSMHCNDMDASSVDGRTWRQHVMYVPQKATLGQGSVYDNLMAPWDLSCRVHKQKPEKQLLRQHMDMLGLDDVELSRDTSRLSGGQEARVALLRALELDAEVFLLDEVDAALDDATADRVGAFIQHLSTEKKSAFLRVRHRAADGYANRRLCLSEQKLVEQTI